jgi:hypothetical protein
VLETSDQSEMAFIAYPCDWTVKSKVQSELLLEPQVMRQVKSQGKSGSQAMTRIKSRNSQKGR